MTKLENEIMRRIEDIFENTKRGFAKILITRMDGQTIKTEIYLSESEDKKQIEPKEKE